MHTIKRSSLYTKDNEQALRAASHKSTHFVLDLCSFGAWHPFNKLIIMLQSNLLYTGQFTTLPEVIQSAIALREREEDNRSALHIIALHYIHLEAFQNKVVIHLPHRRCVRGICLIQLPAGLPDVHT